MPYEILFLDARDDVLRKRYNESRRRHPLGDAGDAYTGVQRERAFLQGIRNRAAYVLDTSDIRPRDLPKTIAKVLPEYESRDATLLLCSFGYKRRAGGRGHRVRHALHPEPVLCGTASPALRA